MNSRSSSTYMTNDPARTFLKCSRKPQNLSKAQFPCSSPVNRYPQDTLTNPVAKFKCRMKSVVILFSNKTRPFDHQPSGNASPPDCFSFHRFTIGKRWGISSPKPLAWGPEPARPVGAEAWRSVGNRKERHLWRDYASSPVQSPDPFFASRL